MPTIEQSSFTLSNNSYAGCDIKAVVHLYDQAVNASVVRARIQELQAKNIRTIELMNAVGVQIATIERSPPATQAEQLELQRLRQRFGDLEKEFQQEEEGIKNLEDELAREGSFDVTTKVLAEIQTLSVSTFREKQPVRALGSVYPRGFTRGPRSIAGSMIFTVFDRNVLHSILGTTGSDISPDVTTALIDQLPPFDITVAFANEYGHQSRMAILGCEFVSEGQVMSVEDMITENQAQFVARDIDPMRPDGEPRGIGPAAFAAATGATPASSLINSDELYQQYRAATNPWVRTRRNRFI